MKFVKNFPYLTFGLAFFLIFTTIFRLGIPYMPSNLTNPIGAFTYHFLHFNIRHLASNIITLLIFGSVYEIIKGKKNTLVMYIMTYIGVSVLTYAGIWLIYERNPITLIGASGWVAAVVMITTLTLLAHILTFFRYLVTHPILTAKAFLRFPLHTRILFFYYFIAALLVVIGGLSALTMDITMFVNVGTASRVSNPVHLIGYLTGILCIVFNPSLVRRGY